MSLIALGRSAGFSLDEIAGMFCGDAQVRIDRDRLASKADKVDRTIQHLSALRDACAMPPTVLRQAISNARPFAA